MSDSDDTDILLLIPPNYYLINAEEKLLYENIQILQNRQYTSFQELGSLQYKPNLPKRNLTRRFEAMDLAVCKSNVAQAIPSASQLITSYQFLPSTMQSELNCKSNRLCNIEKENVVYGDNLSDISSISTNTVRTQYNHNKSTRELVGMVNSTPKCMNSSFTEQFPAKKSNNCGKEVISDISSISTNTVRTQFRPSETNRKTVGIVHSTPKYMSPTYKEQPPAKRTNNIDKGEFLSEIDNFLLNNENFYNQQHSDRFCLEQVQRNVISDLIENGPTQTNAVLSPIQIIPSEEKDQMPNCQNICKADNDLISLSEIWGRSGQATTIAVSSQTNLKEEQLRRQHLEKTVRLLQSRLLEYQQRLSVAIEVDRTKDNALNNAQIEIKSLNQEMHYLRKNLQDSDQQRKIYGDKTETLQNELVQAISLASKFQEKTEQLEQELSNCSRKINETCNQYKQKMEELEIIAHASKRSEEIATNELLKIRDKYVKSEHLHEKTKLRCDELEKENSTLRHQKDMLQEYHQKQKCRAENLDVQRKSLQQSLAQLTENETNLRKKLELQQKTLKSHYQQQLENVVAQKLKEFQEQLDKTEETLKSEARDRERLIAERAVKQLELINEKNELELNLLQEKHNEEVELYRIQLANASKKIDDMEMKLNIYKSKRADIAEKLHNIMETQWQKALEILTSPHNLTRTSHNETERESSPDTNETHNKAMYHANMNKENEYETPKSSKKENNLNVVHQHETSPIDKLQAYIELLLSKSPTDFDKLDKILSLTSKAKQAKDKLEKSTKRHCHSKPPWKA